MRRKFILHTGLLILSAGLSATEPDTAFNNQFRRDIGGWIAADATYSILLPDSRTLWLFGDTFIGETEGLTIVPGAKMIRNSAVIQEGNNLQSLFAGSFSEPDDFILTAEPDSNWYWPEHGIVDGDTLRIFLAKFRHEDNGTPGFNFAHDGNDIANLTYPGLEFINAVPVQAHYQNQVIYGDRLLSDSIYIYIYGRKADTSSFNIPYPHVARCLQEKLLDQNSWEYFNGTGWSEDASHSQKINDFQVSQQYSISKYRGKYILLTQDIWLSPDIYTFIGDSPIGPWRNKTRIFTTPESEGKTFTYNAYVHPQFDREGEMLMSYNVNGDFWSIFSNVEIYRPRFIRVPYMNMSYEFWPNPAESIQNSGNIRIYPNPAGVSTYIGITASTAQNLQWTLYDIKGSILQSKSLSGLNLGRNDLPVNLENQRPGIYLLKVQYGGSCEVFRIIRTNEH